jgi:hypothetical protein
VPALAPALGALGLAGAFPALAGRAGTWFARAALGALGAWWLLLAQALLDRDLWSGGRARGATAAQAWGDAIAAAALLYALVFAVAAAILPWLVRGRSLAPDIVLAAAWAGALGAAAGAVAQAMHAPEPRGLAAGAALAGVLAMVLRRPALVEG